LLKTCPILNSDIFSEKTDCMILMKFLFVILSSVCMSTNYVGMLYRDMVQVANAVVWSTVALKNANASFFHFFNLTWT
jgi:hypothetical protein